MTDYERYRRALDGLDAPLAFVDLDALWANAADLERRAAGTPLRLASKSVRCRELQRRVLDRAPWHGQMTFTLRESLWLGEQGFDDMLLAYPTTDRACLTRLARLGKARRLACGSGKISIAQTTATALAQNKSVPVLREVGDQFTLGRG